MCTLHVMTSIRRSPFLSAFSHRQEAGGTYQPLKNRDAAETGLKKWTTFRVLPYSVLQTNIQYQPLALNVTCSVPADNTISEL